MLYGISTSFPVLSRLERQVAHALLTRPPLSKFEQALLYSVRLECVMHAASVHPEPGSNSRLKSLYLSYLLSLLFSFRNCRDLLVAKFFLASFFCTFFFVLSYFVLSLNRCSIFKDHFAFRSVEFPRGERLIIIAQCFRNVKGFFQSFLRFFHIYALCSLLVSITAAHIV